MILTVVEQMLIIHKCILLFIRVWSTCSEIVGTLIVHIITVL